MLFPTVKWFHKNNISFTDLSGTPCVAIGSDGCVYFCASVKGTNSYSSNSSLSNSYDICVGKISQTGVIEWIYILPSMNTSSDETEPSMVIGPNNELYIAYVTVGAISGQFNFHDLPFFCTINVPSYEDIVIARVDTLPSPTVRWVYQSAYLNSKSSETRPSIAIDMETSLLYVTYECIDNIGCANSGGTPNVAIACFNFNGEFYWKDSTYLNLATENRNTSVSANGGNVYIAYETLVLGKANQVEIAAFQTVLDTSGNYVSNNRLWKASQFTNLTASPIVSGLTECVYPSIASFSNKYIIVSFITDGKVMGNTHTQSVYDLVVLCLNTSGSLLWLKQGNMMNRSPYLYNNCYAPRTTFDNYGNVFVSLPTFITAIGYQYLLFKLNPTNGQTNWEYVVDDDITYNAYPFVKGDGIHAVLPYAPSQVTPFSISVYAKNGVYVVGWSHTESTTPQIAILYMTENLYFNNMGGSEYILSMKAGCECMSRLCC